MAGTFEASETDVALGAEALISDFCATVVYLVSSLIGNGLVLAAATGFFMRGFEACCKEGCGAFADDGVGAGVGLVCCEVSYDD